MDLTVLVWIRAHWAPDRRARWPPCRRPPRSPGIASRRVDRDPAGPGSSYGQRPPPSPEAGPVSPAPAWTQNGLTVSFRTVTLIILVHGVDVEEQGLPARGSHEAHATERYCLPGSSARGHAELSASVSYPFRTEPHVSLSKMRSLNVDRFLMLAPQVFCHFVGGTDDVRQSLNQGMCVIVLIRVEDPGVRPWQIIEHAVATCS